MPFFSDAKLDFEIFLQELSFSIFKENLKGNNLKEHDFFEKKA